MFLAGKVGIYIPTGRPIAFILLCWNSFLLNKREHRVRILIIVLIKLFGCIVIAHLGDFASDNHYKFNHKVGLSLFLASGACDLGELVRQSRKKRR